MTRITKKKKRQNKFIFVTLFVFWSFVLIFNGFTQLLSNWFQLNLGTFMLIAGIGLSGSVIYGLWLASGGKF